MSIMDFVPIVGDLLDFQSNRSARKQAQRQFDAQMDESVQRRVKDAQRAGVHPLFALGASVGASPTLSAGDSRSGSAAARTLANALNAKAVRAKMAAETEASLAQASRDEAEAALANARAATMTQASQYRGSDMESIETFEAVSGEPTYRAPELPLQKPGFPARETGVRSPYVEFRRDDGSKGLAFGAEVPGAEELNTIWIPLQNWWHTTKNARNRIRRALGISGSEYDRMRRDPKYAARKIRSDKSLKGKLTKFFYGGKF